MTTKLLLSVLILSVPNRIRDPLAGLYDKLVAQANGRKDVEILCLIDNKTLSIGEKRNRLLSCARGDFVAFLDDDDTVSDDYLQTLLETIAKNPASDVFAFKQHCTVNGKQFHVDFDLANPNEPAVLNSQGQYSDIRRKPYHMCAWKRIIAQNVPFEDISYGEDYKWLSKLWVICKKQTKIDKVLHFYQYSDESSESIKRK